MSSRLGLSRPLAPARGPRSAPAAGSGPRSSLPRACWRVCSGPGPMLMERQSSLEKGGEVSEEETSICERAGGCPACPCVHAHSLARPPAFSLSVCGAATLPRQPRLPCLIRTSRPTVHGALLAVSPPRGALSPSPGHGHHSALPSVFSFLLSLLCGSVPSFCLLSVPFVSAGLQLARRCGRAWPGDGVGRPDGVSSQSGPCPWLSR